MLNQARNFILIYGFQLRNVLLRRLFREHCIDIEIKFCPKNISYHLSDNTGLAF